MAEGVQGMAGEAITIVGKGIDARRDAVVRCSWSLAGVADTVRDPCWQRPERKMRGAATGRVDGLGCQCCARRP
jgi:hypothetical protein